MLDLKKLKSVGALQRERTSSKRFCPNEYISENSIISKSASESKHLFISFHRTPCFEIFYMCVKNCESLTQIAANHR
jgi:hypothetical protein